MRIYKLKLRHGTAEFEAEGDQQFVEKHLHRVSSLLNLPVPAAPKTPAKPTAKRHVPIKTTPPYPQAAVGSLKAFLHTAKPKGQPATAVAVGAHHMQYFKIPTFTSHDVTSAGKALGITFTNLAVALKSAAKQGRVQKVRKGIWKLAPGKKGPAKPAAKK